MKRTKIDGLKARAEAKASAIANAQKAVGDLELRIEQLKEQAAEAANSGNFEQYQTLAASAEVAAKELLVKRSFMETLNDSHVPEADTLDAWAEYEKDYNKQFDKLLADYESKRRTMLNAYKALIDLQGEALKTRHELALYATSGNAKEARAWDLRLNCKLLPNGMGGNQYLNGKIRMDGINVQDPDAVFYMAQYAKEHDIRIASVYNPDSEAVRILRIISSQQAPDC